MERLMKYTPGSDTLKIYGAIFFLILIGPRVIAQHREIDSLESVFNIKDSEDTTIVSVLIRLSELYEEINFEKSLSYADQAKVLSNDMEFYKGEFYSTMRLVQLFDFQGNFVKEIEAAKIAISIAEEKIRDSSLIAASRRKLGSAYLFSEQTSKALQEFLTAYRLYEKLGNKEQMGWISNSIANAHNNANNFQPALKYYKLAWENFQQSGYEKGVAMVDINMGELLVGMKKYSEAMEHFFRALKVDEEFNNERRISYILSQIAENYSRLGNYEQADRMYNRAISYHNRFIDQGLTLHLPSKSFCLAGLGNLRIKQGRHAQAILMFEEAYAIAKKADYASGVIRASKGLAEAYGKLGKYDKAFKYRTVELIARDSLRSKEYLEKLNEVHSSFQAENNEKELAALKQDRKVKRIFIGLLSGLAFLGLTAIALYINRMRYRIKMDKELKGKEKQRHETELATRELIQKQLRMDLQFKTNELTTYTLHIIQKNEILDDVRKEVDEIGKVSSEDVKSKINRLQNSISRSHRNDKDWDNFRLYFDQVHKGFFDNLTATYPDLNGNDLKLCALLRLNLDTKQIATILDISPESAKVARYRIRKKIGLTNDDNLSSFLNTF